MNRHSVVVDLLQEKQRDLERQEKAAQSPGQPREGQDEDNSRVKDGDDEESIRSRIVTPGKHTDSEDGSDGEYRYVSGNIPKKHTHNQPDAVTDSDSEFSYFSRSHSADEQTMVQSLHQGSGSLYVPSQNSSPAVEPQEGQTDFPNQRMSDPSPDLESYSKRYSMSTSHSDDPDPTTSTESPENQTNSSLYSCQTPTSIYHLTLEAIRANTTHSHQVLPLPQDL
ncbi:hypothetical protein L873DRAFT_518848 [Choiromyces venosus 120613-1]|uniref:Uncharacterized protein n=1 Tax=Choiromyces venosus 120613-1 TaxID=1336337 RepID=A0A3N4K4W1_9PEZI|nr:hypothetical protein L873DRAFT_518848 [Choiromyces venosus 120613-1]